MPSKFMGFWAVDVTRAYEFTGSGPWLSPNHINLYCLDQFFLLGRAGDAIRLLNFRAIEV